ncbi:hypothetical protein Leryth_008194 [Lithospermum erythrorhizon]|nr:hypothetical protein Leryth_008194 [Lithospermum erythrorhizon]
MALKKSNKSTQTATIKHIIKRCSSSFGKKNQDIASNGYLHDVPKGHFVDEKIERTKDVHVLVENKRIAFPFQPSEEFMKLASIGKLGVLLK